MARFCTFVERSLHPGEVFDRDRKKAMTADKPCSPRGRHGGDRPRWGGESAPLLHIIWKNSRSGGKKMNANITVEFTGAGPRRPRAGGVADGAMWLPAPRGGRSEAADLEWSSSLASLSSGDGRRSTAAMPGQHDPAPLQMRPQSNVILLSVRARARHERALYHAKQAYSALQARLPRAQPTAALH